MFAYVRAYGKLNSCLDHVSGSDFEGNDPPTLWLVGSLNLDQYLNQ